MAQLAQWPSYVSPNGEYMAVGTLTPQEAIIYLRVKPDLRWFEVARLDLTETDFRSAVVGYIGDLPVPVSFR